MKKVFFAGLLLMVFTGCKKVYKNTGSVSFSVTSDNLAPLKPGATLIYFEVVLPDSLVIPPTEGTEFSWDLSNVKVLRSFASYYDSSLNPSVPSATYSSFKVDTFGAGSVKIPVTNRYYNEINSADFATLATKVEDTVVLNYPSVGSIVFPSQTAVYSDKIYNAKFPLNYGDSWSGTGVKATYNFIVNAPGLGLNNAPGTQVVTTDYTSRVTSSGLMKLRGYNDNTLPILVVKQQTSQKTNFYLNGSPAPAALLAVAGLTDGQVVTSTTFTFFSPVIGYVGTYYMNNENTDLQKVVLRKFF